MGVNSAVTAALGQAAARMSRQATTLDSWVLWSGWKDRLLDNALRRRDGVHRALACNL